jgi:hypothetical protein
MHARTNIFVFILFPRWTASIVKLVKNLRNNLLICENSGIHSSRVNLFLSNQMYESQF